MTAQSRRCRLPLECRLSAESSSQVLLKFVPLARMSASFCDPPSFIEASSERLFQLTEFCILLAMSEREVSGGAARSPRDVGRRGADCRTPCDWEHLRRGLPAPPAVSRKVLGGEEPCGPPPPRASASEGSSWRRQCSRRYDQAGEERPASLAGSRRGRFKQPGLPWPQILQWELGWARRGAWRAHGLPRGARICSAYWKRSRSPRAFIGA